MIKNREMSLNIGLAVLFVAGFFGLREVDFGTRNAPHDPPAIVQPVRPNDEIDLHAKRMQEFDQSMERANCANFASALLSDNDSEVKALEASIFLTLRNFSHVDDMRQNNLRNPMFASLMKQIVLSCRATDGSNLRKIVIDSYVAVRGPQG